MTASTHIIRHYTHEAGVRNLDREIANICRKVARKVVKDGKQFHVEITPENVNEFLGVLKYRDFWAEKKNEVGLATGPGLDRSWRPGALHRSARSCRARDG